MKTWKVIKDFTKEEIIAAVKTSTSFTGVLNFLKMNPNGKNRKILKDYCRENSIPTNNLIQNHQVREEYEKNPKLCKRCGNPIPWEKRKNEYCCKSCASSEGNKGIVRKRKEGIDLEKELKIKQRRLDAKSAKKHNKLILSKYPNYGIPKILPGCCPICGTYHCENEFCKKHNFQQLIGLVEHLGFDPTTIGTSKVFQEFYSIREKVYDLYWNRGLSMVELGKMFNYSSKIGLMPQYVFKILEIPRRTHPLAQRNYLINNPSVKLKFSDKIFKQNLKTENHISWNGEVYYLRSSYETEYADYLDGLKILYMVEELCIVYFDSQLGINRIAVPDFYLPETNEIIEIKSDFTLDIQEMLDKFEAYKKFGYIPKLILEKEEVDLYNIESQISKERLERIKTKNIKNFKTK